MDAWPDYTRIIIKLLGVKISVRNQQPIIELAAVD